jgi:transcriptional regulator with XRE-family HTH domain
MWETRGAVPRQETLEKICTILGTTTDYLLGIGEADSANSRIKSIQRGLSKLDEKDLNRAEKILQLAFSEAFGGEY